MSRDLFENGILVFSLGVLQDDLTELLDSHDETVARIVETQQRQQEKQKQVLQVFTRIYNVEWNVR